MLDKKIKCCSCTEKDAVWCYMPGGLEDGDFFCDDCVPRGCSCNQYSFEEFDDSDDFENKIYWDKEREKFTKEKTENSKFYEPVDQQGRRYPCCEYFYSEDGYNVDDEEITEENGKN